MMPTLFFAIYFSLLCHDISDLEKSKDVFFFFLHRPWVEQEALKQNITGGKVLLGSAGRFTHTRTNTHTAWAPLWERKCYGGVWGGVESTNGLSMLFHCSGFYVWEALWSFMPECTGHFGHLEGLRALGDGWWSCAVVWWRPRIEAQDWRLLVCSKFLACQVFLFSLCFPERN